MSPRHHFQMEPFTTWNKASACASGGDVANYRLKEQKGGPMLTYGQCRNCVFFRMTEIGDPASQPHYPVGKTQLPKKEYRSGLAYGDCHAHAPTVFQTKTIGVIEQRWPRTQSEYGCGDWQRVTETGEQE